MRNRTVLKMFGIIAPCFTWLFTFFFPGRRAKEAYTECNNKCKIMQLVQNLESYMDPEGKVPLQTIVEKCYAKGSFPALWAVEGAGKDLAEWHMARNQNPKGILTDAVIDPKYSGAWLMLHAGMGMGFAKYMMDTVQPKTEAQVREVVTRTVDLCRANSKPGYFGAAMESLGLVSRFMGSPAFCKQVHAVLVDYAPDCYGFFWRGVGRSLYFHPMNFLPGFLHPTRAIGICAAEAPNEFLKQTMLAGTAWALTVVNMTDPEVMEWTLENHDDYFSGSQGFFNGVISSVVMRYDTTSDDPLIPAFMAHKPNEKNRTLAGLWNSKIKGSLETSLNYIYPVLKKHDKLDEVFHYQSLPALAESLEPASMNKAG